MNGLPLSSHCLSCFVFVGSKLFHSARSDRCGAMGCREEGEVAKLVSLGCTAWTASLPVHEATGYRSRQQWPPTPGGGGVSRSSLNPVNGVHQARSDYGGWGQNAVRIKGGIGFSPWAQLSINAISRISLKSLLCSLVCNLFVMFQVNLRPGVGVFLAPPPPYGISTLSLKRLT